MERDIQFETHVPNAARCAGYEQAERENCRLKGMLRARCTELDEARKQITRLLQKKDDLEIQRQAAELTLVNKQDVIDELYDQLNEAQKQAVVPTSRNALLMRVVQLMAPFKAIDREAVINSIAAYFGVD